MDSLFTGNVAYSDCVKLQATVSSVGSVELTNSYEKHVFIGAIMYIAVFVIVDQCDSNNTILISNQKTLSPTAARLYDPKLSTLQENKKPFSAELTTLMPNPDVNLVDRLGIGLQCMV